MKPKAAKARILDAGERSVYICRWYTGDSERSSRSVTSRVELMTLASDMSLCLLNLWVVVGLTCSKCEPTILRLRRTSEVIGQPVY